jgi:hypothetical protein
MLGTLAAALAAVPTVLAAFAIAHLRATLLAAFAATLPTSLTVLAAFARL